MADEEKRVMPRAVESEQALIGAMILDQNIIPKIMTIVEAADFYSKKNRVIYDEAIKEYIEIGKLDERLLGQRLSDAGYLEKIGGLAYLMTCTENCITSKNAEQYATDIAQKSILRQCIVEAQNISDGAYQQESEFSEYLDGIENGILQITREKSLRACKTRFRIPGTEQHIRSALELMKKQLESKNKILGITTGFPQLDNMTLGFRDDGLTIIGGRPKSGKTSLLCQFLMNHALDGGRPLFITMEMSGVAILQRMAAQLTHVSEREIQTSDYADLADMQSYISGIEMIKKTSLQVLDQPGRTKLQLMALMRYSIQKYQPTMIAVDNLQCMSRHFKESKNDCIDAFLRLEEQFAKEFHVPIVNIAQLRRPKPGTEDQLPQASDFKDCGGIEEAAQLLLILHRPENSLTPKIIISNNRFGPTRIINAGFEGECLYFYERENNHDED